MASSASTRHQLRTKQRATGGPSLDADEIAMHTTDSRQNSVSSLEQVYTKASAVGQGVGGLVERLFSPSQSNLSIKSGASVDTFRGKEMPPPPPILGNERQDLRSFHSSGLVDTDWALSPSICSIPEAQEPVSEQRGSPSRQSLSGQRHDASLKSTYSNNFPTIRSLHENNMTTGAPSKCSTAATQEIIIPLTMTLPSAIQDKSFVASSHNTPSTGNDIGYNGLAPMPSSQPQKSMMCLWEASSVATSIQSEATPVICNTSGKITKQAKSKVIFSGGVPMPLSSSPHLQHPQSHFFHAQLAILEGDEEHDPNKLSDEKGGHGSPKSARSNSCRRSQRVIICLLATLFVCGLVTVIVSFVLSRQNKTAGFEDADSLQDGAGIMDDDVANGDAFNSSTFFGGSVADCDGSENNSYNDTIVIDGIDFATAVMPVIAGTVSPTTPPPTVDTSFSGEGGGNATPAGSSRETLYDSTASPTSAPTISGQKASGAPTNPTTTPTVIPQAIGVSLTSTPLPTTILSKTVVPTVSPTQSPPLLEPDTILEPEAQVQGSQRGDAAGSSVSLSGNGQVMVMGSPNASPSDAQSAGEVQVFERIQRTMPKTFSRQSTANGWEWSLRGSLTGVETMHQFGYKVATNHDGTIVVVSEPTADNRRGQVYIFEWVEEERVYVEKQILVGEQTADHFGISVSLSGDGRRLAVGSPYYSTRTIPGEPASTLRGQVQVFEYSESIQQWKVMQANTSSLFLGSASLDWLGWAVSLSTDGQFLAVGAPRNTEFGGYVQCFQWDGNWKIMGLPILNVIPPAKLDDRFGNSVSITNTASRPGSADNDVARVAIGSPWKDVGNVLNSGMVAIYEWTGSRWLLDTDGALGGVLKETQPGFYHQFGYQMQMDADTIAVGVPGWHNRRGLVNLFWLTHAFSPTRQEQISWERLLTPMNGSGPGEDFGFSVALVNHRSGDDVSNKSLHLSVVVGAIMVSSSNAEAKGYAQIFRTGNLSN